VAGGPDSLMGGPLKRMFGFSMIFDAF